MQFPNEKQLQRLKEKYPAGTILKVISMDDPYHPIPSGTLGEVTMVDDAGTIHMRWQNGSSLGIIEGVDSFEVVDGVKTICYNETKLWASRKEAVDFFLVGMHESDGSEKHRYLNVYLKLMAGETIADDSD